MRLSIRRQEALRELKSLLLEISDIVNVVLVEGLRDEDALRTLGYEGEVDVCSHTGMNDAELAENLTYQYRHILVLTDFDEEGLHLNNIFSALLERGGAVVEHGLRQEVGHLMAAIGVYAIEALDNVLDELERV